MSSRDQDFEQGLTHFANRESDQAIEAFKKAIELDATSADAYMALAQAYRPEGEASLSVYYRKKGVIPEAEAEMAEAMALQRRQ